MALWVFFVLLEVTDKSALVTYLIKCLHFAESVLCHKGYISDLLTDLLFLFRF